MINIPLPSLRDRTGAGRLNDGYQLSPSLSAYLGCDAEIIPCFLDGSGAVIAWAGPGGCSPAPPAQPSRSVTGAVRGRGATGRCPGQRRTHRPEQRSAALRLPPPRNRTWRLARPHPPRPSLVHPANLDRPSTNIDHQPHAPPPTDIASRVSGDGPAVSSRKSIPASTGDHPNGHLRHIALGCLHDEVLDCGTLQDSVELTSPVSASAARLRRPRVGTGRPAVGSDRT